MTPEEFIAKWRGNTRTERAAAQHHFLDLCDLLGVDKPGRPDYDFEKSTRKIGDTQGFADVWRRGCFAWEYKGDRKNLVQAYAQLKQYADALENPYLLIVSDMQEIRVHTNFPNAIAQQHVIPLADLRSVEARDLLRNCFLHPERLRPEATRESVTAQAAAGFARIALSLRQQFDERQVAHFINKLVFCLFAESEGIDLLPDRLFAELLDEAAKSPDECEAMLRELFRQMANPHGRWGSKSIPWFNGGLFDGDDVLPLNVVALAELASAARLDWQAIDPTIFGTLFESGLDDKKRAEMASLFDTPEPAGGQQRLFAAPAANRGVGIHYTDQATIMKIIEPVVMAPLRREWEAIKEQIRELGARRERANSPAAKAKLVEEARSLYGEFRARLGRVPGARPGLRLGQFPRAVAAPLEGFRSRGARRCQGVRPATRRVSGRTRGGAGDRDQRLRRRAGAAHRVDHRAAMAAAKGPRLSPRADPRQARRHCPRRRATDPKRRRTASGPRPMSSSAIHRSSAASACAIRSATPMSTGSFCLRWPRSRRGRSGGVLVC